MPHYNSSVGGLGARFCAGDRVRVCSCRFHIEPVYISISVLATFYRGGEEKLRTENAKSSPLGGRAPTPCIRPGPYPDPPPTHRNISGTLSPSQKCVWAAGKAPGCEMAAPASLPTPPCPLPLPSQPPVRPPTLPRCMPGPSDRCLGCPWARGGRCCGRLWETRTAQPL